MWQVPRELRGRRPGVSLAAPPRPPGRAARDMLMTMVMLAVVGSACGNDGDTRSAEVASQPQSFALYALSRGRGVPEGAKATLAEAEAVLEDLRAQGAEITVTQERIGLEGERRLCVTFADRDMADRAFERIRQLSLGGDLVNLVREPCDRDGQP